MAESFRLYLLGGFRLEKEGAPIRIARTKTKALLAYLALFPGAHTREQLATLFFPDDMDADARKNLRVLFAELYKVLGKEFFSDDRESVELDATRVWTDARELMTDDGRRTTEVAVSSLLSVGALYRGDLLPEFYDDWVLQKRDDLRERYVELLLQLVEHFRAQSEYAAAVEWSQKVLQTDRANERAHQHLMFLYAAQGDRTAALKQFDECVAALGEELGVEPSAETIALAKKIKQQKTGAPSDATRLTNLPRSTTSFIGREKEFREIREMLGGGRRTERGETLCPLPSALITLIGSGGSGKTRLALESGRALVDDFEHGVWWVELAPLATGALVENAIAKALGVQEQPNVPLLDTLTEFLRERELLLILDNCEHLVDACAQIANHLLTQCPNLVILATSREGLNVPGEQIYPVAPLTVPTTDDGSPITEFSAVRLFIERARLAQPQFGLDDANAPFVIQICQRLDGIPLAIEIAAARVKQMSVHDIAARLDQRFDLLVGARATLPRQQTLRALIDWSYDLLLEQERTMFMRLSVFAGGWTIDSAEEICADDTLPRAKILDALLRLVDKSLVTRTDGDETRYTMLETIREYAREKLDAAGETETLRARHLNYFLNFAEQAVESYWDERQPQALAHTDAELNNLRAALETALSLASAESSLRLCGALADYWALRDRLQEGSAYTKRTLAKSSDGVKPIALGKGYAAAGIMAWRRSDSAQARLFQKRALASFERAGDMRAMAYVLKDIGNSSQQQGDLESARLALQRAIEYAEELQDLRLLESALLARGTLESKSQGDDAAEQAYYEQGLDISRQRNNRVMATLFVGNLGCLAGRQGDFTRAVALFDEASELAEQAGFQYGRTWMEIEQGRTLIALGDLVQAEWLCHHGLRSARASGDQELMIGGLEAFAALEHARANYLAAVRLYAAAGKWRASLNQESEREGQSELEARLPLLQAALGKERFEAAWLAGQVLTLEQAVELCAPLAV